MEELWDRAEKLLHQLWGSAHDSPSYKKRDWLDFQQTLEDIKKQELMRAVASQQVPKSERRCKG